MVHSRKALVLFLIIVVLIAILPGQATKTIPIEAGILYSLIGIISIWGLLHSYSFAPISLNIIHWIFVLVFFFVAPIAQAAFGFSPWNISMDGAELTKTNALILLWIMFYLFGSRFGRRIHINEPKAFSGVSPSIAGFVLLISCACAIIIVTRVGISNVFTRGELDAANASLQQSTAVSLILDKCTRAVIVFAEALFIFLSPKHRHYRSFLIANSAALLLSCFPFALARNSVGIIYFGLLVVFLCSKRNFTKSTPFFIVAFLIGIVIVFPLIDVFRRFSFSSGSLLAELRYAALNLRTVYLSGNYDAYAVVTAVRNHVARNGLSLGRQLLGAVLFFVPRSIWPTKPVGSGSMVASARGMLFTNISCPLIAEGYINLGIPGVVLFAFFFGSFCSVLDRKYWFFSYHDNRLSYVKLVYPFLLPAYFFMLRGDLMSSWAYTFAYVFVFYVLASISRLRIKLWNE